ncbi:MAG: sulfur reduction protein DsrS [Pseudomonadota bacterium]
MAPPNHDPLTPEDALRLNVLLAGELLAVRIDEGAAVLFGLTPRGEARVQLNPAGRAERYFQQVRELLGGHALGSPGGYPVYLRRWTRMGQASAKNLEALLKLGEPEAALAVAHAPTLSDELARRVWWALPTPETARVMLERAAVRAGAMGPVLADYLIEHLPFEEDPIAAMHTVRAVLAAGVLAPAARDALWAKAKRRPHYLIGFLEHLPAGLPAEAALPPLEGLGDTAAARLLARVRGGTGQAWLKAAELALDKPPAHEAVYLLLDLIGAYFADGREAAAQLPARPAEAAALAALACVSNAAAEPILTRTTAVGPLMRRHLEPLFAPMIAHLRLLRGQMNEP